MWYVPRLGWRGVYQNASTKEEKRERKKKRVNERGRLGLGQRAKDPRAIHSGWD